LSEAVELAGKDVPVATVREHTTRASQVVTLFAIVIPPIPAFYIGGEDMGRFLDHYALRVLDRLGVAESGAAGLRWQ